jgi:hypothetical protein
MQVFTFLYIYSAVWEYVVSELCVPTPVNKGVAEAADGSGH